MKAVQAIQKGTVQDVDAVAIAVEAYNIHSTAGFKAVGVKNLASYGRRLTKDLHPKASATLKNMGRQRLQVIFPQVRGLAE